MIEFLVFLGFCWAVWYFWPRSVKQKDTYVPVSRYEEIRESRYRKKHHHTPRTVYVERERDSGSGVGDVVTGAVIGAAVNEAMHGSRDRELARELERERDRRRRMENDYQTLPPSHSTRSDTWSAPAATPVEKEESWFGSSGK